MDGTHGCTLLTAKYVPPMPEELMESLGKFEAIHLFLDGNGPIGRLHITLLLIERNMLSTPFLCLSAFFEAKRSEYYKQHL